MPKSTADLRRLFLEHVPADGSPIGNIRLRQLISDTTGQEVDADDFAAVRVELVNEGVLLPGAGRGGTVRLADTVNADDGNLRAEEDGEDKDGDTEADDAGFRLESPSLAAGARRPVAKKRTDGTTRRPSEPEAIAVLSYRHGDRRKNNPEVGMVTPYSDPDQPKTAWKYDPHIDPALQFDVGRSDIERVIDDALAAGTDDAMRAALTQLRRQTEPYLAWTGKAERTSFDVDTVSLHVHERVDPLSILSAARGKAKGEKKAGDAPSVVTQLGLFSAPFENLPLRNAIDFYKHDKGWSNRLVAGDSLLVMNSLLQKESMAGQVQMVYMDPPYGIAYGSNFQPFVSKKEVRDRRDEDLTGEPETLRAFRDTWELGIHSYLSYLRDRALLALDLLAPSGSMFLQISAENMHRVRAVMDEVFGADNHIETIAYRTKNMTLGGQFLEGVFDYVVWYAKDKTQAKFRRIFTDTIVEGDSHWNYYWLHGLLHKMTSEQIANHSLLPPGADPVQLSALYPTGVFDTGVYDFEFAGQLYTPPPGRCWKSPVHGMRRVEKSGRIIPYNKGDTLRYAMRLSDYPMSPLHNIWADTAPASSKVYVVQTGDKVIQRCMLMVTDPGDLVFDPTCGSGTTAFVAEKWGRRWITCDTSRVSVTLAKQRIMTAGYDYYELKYPHEGLRGGFVYDTAPHVTLKSISNNPEIDSVWARMHPLVETALATLNRSLRENRTSPYKVESGGRRGSIVDFSADATQVVSLPSGEKVPKGGLKEWEVPQEFPPSWPKEVRPAFDAYRKASSRLVEAMDASISAHSEQEVLYDRPRSAKDKVRITGPFTVEAVPFPMVLSLEQGPLTSDADATVARSGGSSRHHQWRDELLRTGVRGKGGQRLMFASLETLPDTRYLHASGHLKDTGERVVVSFGPEYAALEQRQVEMAMQEAGDLFPRPKMIVFCAFTFDPEAAKDIDHTKGIVALKVQMNTDLLTEDLKKARSSNQSFWLMGQPDVEVRKRKDGNYEVEVHGFDYFDTTKGTLVSGGKAKIAMWMLDTDFDERSLFPRQVFFPMAGADDGWRKLRKTIRAELDEDKLDAFHGTVSLPFEAGDNKKAAVKIIDDRGIESLKVLRLD